VVAAEGRAVEGIGGGLDGLGLEIAGALAGDAEAEAVLDEAALPSKGRSRSRSTVEGRIPLRTLISLWISSMVLLSLVSLSGHNLSRSPTISFFLDPVFRAPPPPPPPPPVPLMNPCVCACDTGILAGDIEPGAA
jgi:hypothetical protein